MNNQAAQTMPLPEPEVLLHSPTHGHVYGYTTEQMRAYGDAREAAALSQPAGVPLERAVADLAATVADEWLEMFAAIPGLEKYERYTYGPAVTLLRDQLREMLASTPAASGGKDECAANFTGHKFGPHGPKGATQCEWCGEEPQPPSGASVSERARELLATEYERDGSVAFARMMREGKPGHLHAMAALRAIERALSSPRQEGDGQSGYFIDGKPVSEDYHDGFLDGACRIAASTQGLREGYYLASFKRSHDRGYVTWWMANDAGYTSDLNQAGIYTELKPGYHDSEYTVPVPVSFIDRLRVRRMIDVGDSDNRALWTAKDLRSALESLLTSPTTGADGEA
jgi:hypothetical protein